LLKTYLLKTWTSEGRLLKFSLKRVLLVTEARGNLGAM
jgi:hypothetical protein